MKRIASFEKVSFEMFLAGWKDAFGSCEESAVREIYKGIKLPERATSGSAGYDFFAPDALTVSPGDEILVPTGIRVRMEPGWVLMLYPRSSLGFRYRLQLNNTVGIIDSDYYDAENEGHIFCRLTNDSHSGKTVRIAKGNGFVQGVFVPFGITVDDDAGTLRTGGFGSTDQESRK